MDAQKCLAACLLLLAAAPARVADDPEVEAAELLAKAEEKAAKGQHRTAVSLYKKIVKKYPATAAAEVAERRSQPNAFLGIADVMRSGPSSNRVDVVMMGDGYPIDDVDEYGDIVDDVPRVFERNRTFEEYLSYLNILRADVVSEEAGIDGFGREKSTALGGAISEGEQSQVTVDRALVRAMMDQEIPDNDGVAVVLVQRGTLGTGGGGVAAVAQREFDTLVHEFGHAFGNLRDEYTTYTGFRGDETTSHINVSGTPDETKVPWAHWIAAKVKGIGVYEGADGRVRGAWKPTTKGCVMGDGEFFCPVCREALVLRIYDFVDPIDAAYPDAFAEPIQLARDGEPIEFSVQVMRPATHKLEVSWWFLPEAEAPVSPPYNPELASAGARASRGPLPAIDAKPDQFGRNDKRGIYSFELKPAKLAPGHYSVICRAVDTTKLRGEKWPWVLKDDNDLLKSERVWTVVVR